VRGGDALQDEKGSAPVLIGGPGGDDVGVATQADPYVGLLKEALVHAEVVCEAWVDRLDSCRPPYLMVVTEVDDAHAPGPDLPDFVAALDAIPDLVGLHGRVP
jgi:hypothetical protein